MEDLILFIKSLAGQLPGFVAGVISALLVAYGSGYIAEYFTERGRIAKHKRDVARLVIKICTEASTSSYCNTPRDMERVNSVLTDLEGIDKEMCLDMETLISSWGVLSRRRSNGKLGTEDIVFATDLRNRAEEKRLKLITWATKIRLGK